METLRSSIYYLEAICLLFAFITYKSYSRTPNVYIFILLILTFLIETVGFFNYNYPNNYFIENLKTLVGSKLINENLWLYNLGMVFTFVIYIIYYYKLLKSLKSKFFLKIIFIIYIIVCIVDIVQNYEFITVQYFNYIRIFGALSLLVCSVLYLNEVFKSNRVLYFYKTLPFWVTIGALVFYLTTIPIFIFASQLKFSHNIYVIILVLSNYVLYGSMTLGFIINAYRKRKHNKKVVAN